MSFEEPEAETLEREGDVYDSIILSKVLSESEQSSFVKDVCLNVRLRVNTVLSEEESARLLWSDNSTIFDKFIDTDSGGDGADRQSGLTAKTVFNLKYFGGNEASVSSAVPADYEPKWLYRNRTTWVEVDVFANILLELPNGDDLWVNRVFENAVTRNTSHPIKTIQTNHIDTLATVLECETSERPISVSFTESGNIEVQLDSEKTVFEQGRSTPSTVTRDGFNRFLTQYLREDNKWCTVRLGEFQYNEEESVCYLPVSLNSETVYFEFENPQESDGGAFWQTVEAFGGGDPLQVDNAVGEIAFEPIVRDKTITDSKYTVCKYGLWVLKSKPNDTDSSNTSFRKQVTSFLPV